MPLCSQREGRRLGNEGRMTGGHSDCRRSRGSVPAAPLRYAPSTPPLSSSSLHVRKSYPEVDNSLTVTQTPPPKSPSPPQTRPQGRGTAKPRRSRWNTIRLCLCCSMRCSLPCGQLAPAGRPLRGFFLNPTQEYSCLIKFFKLFFQVLLAT